LKKKLQKNILEKKGEGGKTNLKKNQRASKVQNKEASKNT
jgi:hypothetical protein